MSPLLRCAFPQSEIVDRDKHSYSYISKLQSTWNRNTGIFFLLDFRIFRIAGRIQPVQSHSLLYSNARTRLSLLQPNQQIKSLISPRNCHQKENSNLLMSLLLKRQRRLPSAHINLQKILSDFLTASSQASAQKTSPMPLNTLKVSEHHLPNKAWVRIMFFRVTQRYRYSRVVDSCQTLSGNAGNEIYREPGTVSPVLGHNTARAGGKQG